MDRQADKGERERERFKYYTRYFSTRLEESPFQMGADGGGGGGSSPEKTARLLKK